MQTHRTRSRRFRGRPAVANTRPDLTPMIDVTFLILIFFMLTIRFRTLEGKLDSQLPRNTGVTPAHSVPIERARVTIEVLAAGTLLDGASDAAWDGSGPHRFGPDRRLRYTCGPQVTESLDGVRDYLRRQREHDPALELVVDARGDTIYADAVAVIDMASLLGFESITLAGARD